MKIRALCTDIDGTLLDARRELSSRTIEIFRKLPPSMPIVLASSRMPSAMFHLQEELGISNHPLICYNGGYSIHYNKGLLPNIFATVSIPTSVCTSILEFTKDTGIHISLYHEDQWYAPSADHWTDREQRITKVNATIREGTSVIRQWEQENRGAHKVMCMGPEDEIHVMEQKLRRSFDDQLHIYRSRPTYLELAARSVSKATALKLILNEHLGIDLSEVMAFGDNYNDTEMLRAVGFGIAVGNARPEVKSVAREVTANSIDDGVAIAIEKYLFK